MTEFKCEQCGKVFEQETSLKQHVVGLEEVGDGVWSLYFCNVLLARVDERDYILRA